MYTCIFFFTIMQNNYNAFQSNAKFSASKKILNESLDLKNRNVCIRYKTPHFNYFFL